MSAASSYPKLTDMPADVILEICNHLTLEEIATLQGTHDYLDTIIDSSFFPKFKKMRLALDENGPELILTSRSAHAHLNKEYSISVKSSMRSRVIMSCTSIDTLSVSCSDHNRDYSILDIIKNAGLLLKEVTASIKTKTGKDVCRITSNRTHRGGFTVSTLPSGDSTEIYGRHGRMHMRYVPRPINYDVKKVKEDAAKPSV